ncbi:MAG: bifunctional nitrate reductase/sulfite reductase flavoprotein subunit alpha [Gordonia sp. (in: high G+C Gram-positive bacteria)]|uniref:molybdopterin-dependent oxidoreductase n=1 Tax=Gordonia sp. (in: high G+C Gram-positive bacteria) TaxID=84139 RepID=UPI003C707C26
MTPQPTPPTRAASSDTPTGSVETVCGYCGVGCGITLDVSGGAVTGSRGTAAHPANRGRLCTKGATTADLLNAPGRLTAATLREDRDRERRTVAVDDAVDATARRLARIRDRHGPGAIALYVSGQMSLEAQYLANKFAKGFLGTNQIESNSRLCMAGAGTGYKQSLGADGPPGSYDDIDHADAFLVIGANMADCHPILFLRMMDRVAAGARLIVVDPRRTATARKAHLHLPVRPGTDLALLNGLLHLIIEAGGVDDAFIAAHTDGWDQTAALAADYPPARVADLTGVDEVDLRAAAQILCGAADWMTLWTMGLNQSTHGTWNTNAVCNLHLATGTICRTGSGPFSLTGQPNAMGGREMGYMGPGLPGQRTVADPAHRAEVEQIWGVPPGTLRSDAGRGTVDMFQALADGRIRAVWIICTNPVASVANRATVIAALERAEFVVVQEAFAGAETAEYADVVLPAALWSEAEGTMVNSERSVALTVPALPPPGQARADWQLISQVARGMGYVDGFSHPDAAAVFDEITGFYNPQTGWDLRGIDYRRLRRGPVQWPAAPGGPDRNPIRYRTTVDADGAAALTFPTPDGRARFWPRPHLPPAELPDDVYPFTLTTGRVAHQWHTMTKTGRVAKLCRLDPESFVQLHPDDAAACGIADGDLVEVRSRRGAARVAARLDEDIRAGVCFVPMHWADGQGADLAINAVTNDAVDPESFQPEFKACAVSLVRIAGAVPDTQESPVTAFHTSAPATSTPAASTPAASTPAFDTSDSLAAALGVRCAEPSFTDTERGYLAGLLHGLAANPPMGSVPTVPSHAPLSAPTRAWVDGVLAGYFARLPLATSPEDLAVSSQSRRIRVVWSSQTGTAEEYAAECGAGLRERGFDVITVCADRVGLDDLIGDALFVVATTGDGDAPDSGVALWDALAGARDAAGLRYAVLGFGDSSYADFCGFARRLDARLHTLGAVRTSPAAYCEPDFAETAAAWFDAVANALAASDDPGPERIVEVISAVAAESPPVSRKHPVRAPILDTVPVTAPESAKSVRRIAFSVDPAQVRYSAGDALGVWPRNHPELVDEWLRLTGCDGETTVTVGAAATSLRAALTDEYEIAACTHDLVAFVAARRDDADLMALADDPIRLAQWATERQSVDVLAAHPVTASPAEWLTVIRRLRPRLYSISSSPSTTPERIEVMVSAVRFGVQPRQQGVCSGHLHGLIVGDDARIFVQRNNRFRLPADPDAPIIMIGPGTGVAPFRGFLHERAASGAPGDNWLFFGERHRETDFYFRDELTGFLESGLLTRLDLAFSRDQPEKVYVQDRMRDAAAEIWAWLRRGAYVYVCGDAAQMARDVDDRLRAIVAEHGRLSPSGAGAFVQALAADGRYVRDVY